MQVDIDNSHTTKLLCRLPHSSSKQGPGPHKGRDKEDVRGMMPIIIVPAAATANVNMANAKVCASSSCTPERIVSLIRL